MMRLTQAITAVMGTTFAGGVAGGAVGAAIGRFAPSFVLWICEGALPKAAVVPNPSEFGFGLGSVSGLFFGAGVGSFLVAVIALRDAWLARAGIALKEPEPEAAWRN